MEREGKRQAGDVKKQGERGKRWREEGERGRKRGRERSGWREEDAGKLKKEVERRRERRQIKDLYKTFGIRREERTERCARSRWTIHYNRTDRSLNHLSAREKAGDVHTLPPLWAERRR